MPRFAYSKTTSARAAFTLIELLVVLAIIGILIGTMAPALTSSRETARRLQCGSNLSEVGLALQDYVAAYEMLPAGTTGDAGPVQNTAAGVHHGWILPILPYLDYPAAFEETSFAASVYADENRSVRELFIPKLICPSEVERHFTIPPSSYAGCQNDLETPIDQDNNGCFFLSSQLRLDDLTDGRSQTLLVGEKIYAPGDLGWMSGTRATLRNTGSPVFGAPGTRTDDGGQEEVSLLYVGSFGSHHPGGLQFLFANGAVQFLENTIDLQMLQQLANRDDRLPLAWPEHR